MVVIVTLGLAFAILAMFALFFLMFIEVAFKPPHASATRSRSGELESPGLPALTASVLRLPARSREAIAASRGRCLPQVGHSDAGVTINSRLFFSRHTRHLRILLFLITAGAGSALFVRSQLVPAAFGDRGPYRAAALEQIASQPSQLTSDASCLKCHSSVQEERADSPHQAVRCMHCHGNGHEHMAAALIAVDSPDHPIPLAGEWDGDFHTKLDLFITQDRATCLSCHASVVGMPSSFRSIDVAQHLEEQGAENVNAKDVCFECHTGHSPGI